MRRASDVSVVPLSDAERRTLQVLADAHGPLMAREVALALWPDAKGWNRHSTAGNRNTSRVGAQMGAAAGVILRRLERRGCVRVGDPARNNDPRLRYVPHFSISHNGRSSLRSANKKEQR